MFTAGGIAAGKSSVVNDEVIAAQDLVYDATLRETGWAIRNIEKALENGWEVQIVYVQRPIELAMQGAVDRAGQQGRSFPLADLPAAHRDAQRSIIEIAKRFEGNENVRIGYWLNAGTQGEKATKLSLHEIDKGGKYSYEHISHVTDARRTESLARSYEESDSERIRTASRGAVLDAFQRAVGRKDLSREVLSGLAGKDPELQRILKESGR
ncbi:MAG: zeta toxin family protein [Akkermansiaceae bacterium]|nr:zeta toxin family protein [Akkermansiaceae bacterium]